MCSARPNRNPGIAELASAAIFVCAWRAAASARWHTSVSSPAIAKIAKQPVAHEFQHLGAVVEDHRHLTIEIAIEEVDQQRAAADCRPTR